MSRATINRSGWRGFELKFKEIPLQIYESFHKKFSGINEDTFETCRKCGGACEYNKIITLLPGEREYMAKQMGISTLKFEARYLDTLRMDDGTRLYVLKLGELCPFLNKETKECGCKNFKPIFCKVYPVVFTVEAENIKFTLDNWCKLSQIKEFQVYFETAIPLLLSLPIPIDWFRYVASYDYLCFDYNQLEKYKNEKKIYGFFSLKEVLGSEKNEIEIASICINFS
jgi:uncharacterized protein